MNLSQKIATWVACVLAAIYGIFCILVFVYPKPFFYNPTTVRSDINHAHKYGYKAREVTYNSKDGTPLLAWYTEPHNGQKKIIVFMHGNSYNIEEFYYKLKTFANAGYGTFLPEYRGYGDVAGEITQENLEADAIAAVEYLHSQGYKNKDIYVYGMSLGSHMATNSVYQLQKKEAFAGLILEVPFDNLMNVVRLVVPVPLPLEVIMRDKYDNLAMIENIKSPILIMGGSIDTTVPVELAQNLYNYAPEPKKIIIYENGKHSNLFNFRNDLDILDWMKANENGWLKSE